jgi:hypothetical protein
VELHNCAVIDNLADSGGGLHCIDDGSATIKNSIFWSNKATKGPQIALDSTPFSTSKATVGYSDRENGSGGIFVGPGSLLIWEQGNIDADPCFALLDSNSNPNLWDFHLQSEYGRWDDDFYRIDFDGDGIVNFVDFSRLANHWMRDVNGVEADLNRDGTVEWMDLRVFNEYFLTAGLGGEWVLDASTSPCIDYGDPNSDWTAESWPNGRRINMGAFGGTKQASRNGNIADFDVDGDVDFADFANFADKWQVGAECIEDLSNNGLVDFFDFDIFADNWLWQR